MSDNCLPLMRAAEYIGVSHVKLSQLAIVLGVDLEGRRDVLGH